MLNFKKNGKLLMTEMDNGDVVIKEELVTSEVPTDNEEEPAPAEED